MANAPRDENQVTTLLGEDDTTGLPSPLLTDAVGNLLVAAMITDVPVADGGTGLTSLTPYAVITGGTTATGPMQQVSGVGTSGQVLTSNGASALPSWQSAGAAGANTALSNLASVALNTALLPDAAAADDFGSATLPFKDLFFAGSSGTPGTNNFKITGASTGGLRTITFPDASGTATLLGNTPTGSGSVVLATSPSLTTPSLGVATATSINKVAITAPASSATLTLADGSSLVTSGGNSITLTSTGATNVTLPTTGTLVNTAVTTLSSLASVGTISTGVWNGTDIAVADGGTGLSSTTAYAVLCGGTTSTAALQSIASVGTSGQVLTSNGAGALPTFQDASGGGSPRRTFAMTMNTDNITNNGSVAATNVPYGLQCSINTDGGSSLIAYNFIDEANFDMYDSNPEFNIITIYDAGSATGTGTMYFGDVAGTSAPSLTTTSKSMFVIGVTTAGTLAWSAVNANGTTNTNATITSVTAGLSNSWRIVMDGTTSIKTYLNGTLKVTSTTNLPSGDSGTATMMQAGVKNNAGDTTTRTARFGFFNLLLDSPNA